MLSHYENMPINIGSGFIDQEDDMPENTMDTSVGHERRLNRTLDSFSLYMVTEATSKMNLVPESGTHYLVTGA